MVPQNLNVLVGVTGGIAAYKTVSFIRLLKKAGANVRVVMTENAARFVTPLTFEEISGQPALLDTFGRRESFAHISLRKWADILIVAPATANFMARTAAGIADDLLTTTVLSFSGPRWMAPAMNTGMWDAPPTGRNRARLEEDGWSMIGPEGGDLACGDSGSGRMSEPETIFRTLFPEKRIAGKLVVTAGATRQPVDAVRFITNHSSGRMGTAIARAAVGRFEEVVLVHAALSVPVPGGVRAVEAMDADTMLEAVRRELPGASALVMAAAVSDYTPATVREGKMKKGEGPLSLELVRTPDILAETAGERRDVYTVGFAMESDNLEANARGKLLAKGLDLILANPVGVSDAGFGSRTNRVLLLGAGEIREDWGLLPKSEIAGRLVDRLEEALS